MSTKFFFNGFEYVLKSGMLYTGSGDGGHWRCIVLIGDRLILFDDEKNPVEGTMRDLKLGTDFIFCKNVPFIPTLVGPICDTSDVVQDVLPKNTFICTACKKSFSRAQYLRRHQLTDHTVHPCDDYEDFFSLVPPDL